MINEINTPLKKSKNIILDSLPKITKTYIKRRNLYFKLFINPK